jgi:hypothetical protein
MTKQVRFILMSLVLSTIYCPAWAQSGSYEAPSISAEAGHVFIANRTFGEVVFYLSTPQTQRTEMRLNGSSSGTYTGKAGDSEFAMFIYIASGEVKYRLRSGQRYYLDYNQAGNLEVFAIPPN